MQFKELSGTLYVQTFVESVGNAASTGNLPVWRAPHNCQIVSAVLVPAAAITANGSAYSTYTLTRHAAGASATTVATRAWDTGDSAAVTPESMTLSGTAANLLLDADQTLSIVKTVTSTGLLIPACLVVVGYKLTGA